jgi:hypothetical protein
MSPQTEVSLTDATVLDRLHSLPIERIESLRPALRFRVSLGDGIHILEVLR